MIPLSKPAQLVIVLACLIVVLAGMKAAAFIIGPLLFSGFLAILFGMLIQRLEEKEFPRWLALAVSIAAFLASIAAIALLLAVYFTRFLLQLPFYQENLETRLSLIHETLPAAGIDPAAVPVSELVSLAVSTLGNLIVSIGNSAFVVLIIIITTIFLMVEIPGLMLKLERSFEDRAGFHEDITRFGSELIRYIVIRMKIDLFTGAGIFSLLFLLGVDFALLWGFFAFILGFIPYLGFWLAILPPTLLAWAEMGWGYAAVVLAGGIIINEIAESLLFPQLAGQQFRLSPVVVLISVIFWGWILGFFGALLAVPLTLALKLMLDKWEETRFIGAFLASSPPADSEAAEPGRR
ncbi:MAG: AI-2E family transporter [Methanomicrobiales archaeon]|nr:AI-2E family transporter [Methanomicrobiales archaeon]